MEKEIDLKELKQYQMQRLMENQTLPNVGGFFITIILAILQWSVIKHSVIISWIVFTFLSFLIMWGLLFSYYKRKPKKEELLAWNKQYFIGITFFTLVWASASFFLFPKDSLIHQFFLSLIIVGVCSSTVICLSASWKSVSFIITVILTPLILHFILMDDFIYKLLGAMIVMYDLILLYVAKYNNDIINEVIILRVKTNEQENKLQNFEKRYEEFIESLPVGVFRCKFADKDDFILANSSLVHMLGYNRKEEFLSNSINDLCFDPSAYKLFRISLISNEHMDSEKIQFKKKDGSTMLCKVTSRVVRNSEGKLEYFDGIIQED